MNIGDRFGRLVIVGEAPRMYRKIAWRCACDCGGEVSLPGTALRQGNTKSCGCLHRETATALCVSRTKHGHARRAAGQSATLKSWSSILQRCTNPKNPGYADYGGRGITVCDRWRSFENFLSDMGERPPGTSIDRKDNAKGYEPDNCRWATAAEQAQNQRRNVLDPAKVIAMREMIARGISIGKAARAFGVSREVASSVKNGRAWRNIVA